MHPNPQFRSEDRQLLETLIEEIGFGMVFLTTPDGPRVAHTPLLSTGTGQVRFHLARGNALTRHLAGANALVTVNGADGYVSPRWYDNRDTVPTWDYVALEMEGPIRLLTDEELEEFLHAAIARHEARIEGAQWQAGESSETTWSKLFGAIVGFELDVQKWRPTLKLSQKKSVAERARIAEGHTAAGRPAVAAHMRTIGA